VRGREPLEVREKSLRQSAIRKLTLCLRSLPGAYERSALGNLGYALLVLKIFNPDFAKSAFSPSLNSVQSLISGALQSVSSTSSSQYSSFSSLNTDEDEATTIWRRFWTRVMFIRECCTRVTHQEGRSKEVGSIEALSVKWEVPWIRLNSVSTERLASQFHRNVADRSQSTNSQSSSRSAIVLREVSP